MNKRGREKLSIAIAKIEDGKSVIDEVLNDEQCSYDNTPESFQSTERYEMMESNIDVLTDAISEIEEIMNNIEEVINS